MSATGSKEFWLDSLRAESATFRAVAIEVIEADRLNDQVPTCPDWTVLDLMHHLGGVYRWVRAHVSRGVTSKPDPQLRQQLMRENFPSPGDTLAWWEAELQGLFELLTALDPQTPAWNWAPQAKVAGFWPRRMAHETAIHRWDIQMAAQGLAEPIEARLAADGVSEVLDSWLPAGRRKGPTNKFGVVQLIAADTGQEWFLRLRGEGVALLDTATIFDDDDPHPRVQASGSASDLLLALWGRVGFDTLEVTGDESLLPALQTG